MKAKNFYEESRQTKSFDVHTMTNESDCAHKMEAKATYEDVKASSIAKAPSSQNTTSSRSRSHLAIPSRSKSMEDEEKTSLAAPARKHQSRKQLSQSDEDSQDDVSSVKSIAPDDLDEYDVSKISAVPKKFGKYRPNDASIVAAREFDEHLATITGPAHEKKEDESHDEIKTACF